MIRSPGFYIIGDSLTNGTKAPPGGPVTIPSWATRMIEDGRLGSLTILDADGGVSARSYLVDNGETVNPAAVPQFGREYAMIFLGSVDALRLRDGLITVQDYKDDITTLATDLRARGFKRVVKILPPLTNEPNAALWNDWIVILQGADDDLVNIDGVFTAADLWDVPTQPGPYYDNVHPNDEGHENLADKFEAQFTTAGLYRGGSSGPGNHVSDEAFTALRALGYTGTRSDMMLQWLNAGGPIVSPNTEKTIPDAWKAALEAANTAAPFTTAPYDRNDWWYGYLGSVGYTGTYSDRQRDYWIAQNP